VHLCFILLLSKIDFSFDIIWIPWIRELCFVALTALFCLIIPLISSESSGNTDTPIQTDFLKWSPFEVFKEVCESFSRILFAISKIFNELGFFHASYFYQIEPENTMILTRFTLGSNERKLRFSWITVRGLRASNECSEAGMVSALLLVGERFLPRMM